MGLCWQCRGILPAAYLQLHLVLLFIWIYFIIFFPPLIRCQKKAFGQAAGFPFRGVIQHTAGSAFRGKCISWKSSFQKNKQHFWLVSHIVILPASFVFQMGEIKVNNPRAMIWFERNVISEREICKNSHNQEMRNILRNWQFRLIFHVVYLHELVLFYCPCKCADNQSRSFSTVFKIVFLLIKIPLPSWDKGDNHAPS